MATKKSYIDRDLSGQKLLNASGLTDEVGAFAGLFTTAQISAYTGSQTVLTTRDGRVYKRTTVTASTPDVDGAFCLAVSGSTTERWVRQINDRLVTPYDFDAVGDGVADDGAKLQAWLNLEGVYDLYWPAGNWKSSIALTRTNKGTCSIFGPGITRCKILFSNDTNGLSVSNTASFPGQISLQGFSIYSTGTKTTGKVGLYVSSQGDQRPGVILNNVYVESNTSTSIEWTTHIHLHDCTQTSTSKVQIRGGSFGVSGIAEGLKITNQSGTPSVEHNLYDVNIRAVKDAVKISGNGSPAVEGVNISLLNATACTRGVVATSASYGAPIINITDSHIDSHGGEAIDIDNFQQVHLSGVACYVSANGGVTPTRGVRFNAPLNLKGDLLVNLQAAVPYAVEFTGTGQGIDLDIAGNMSHGSSGLVQVGANVTNTLFGLTRIWKGTNGPNTGLTINDLSGQAKQKIGVSVNGGTFTDGNLFTFNSSAGQIEGVSRVRAARLRDIVVTNSTTVDASVYNLVRVLNGATAITITLSTTNLVRGDVVRMKKYDIPNATGTITVQTSNPGTNNMQNASLEFVSSLTLGNAPMAWMWQGTHFELIQ